MQLVDFGPDNQESLVRQGVARKQFDRGFRNADRPSQKLTDRPVGFAPFRRGGYGDAKRTLTYAEDCVSSSARVRSNR
jgi:hypothetical protein